MSWAATVRVRDGLVEVQLSRGDPVVAMDPEVARTLAATLLVVAEAAECAEAQRAAQANDYHR